MDNNKSREDKVRSLIRNNIVPRPQQAPQVTIHKLILIAPSGSCPELVEALRRAIAEQG